MRRSAIMLMFVLAGGAVMAQAPPAQIAQSQTPSRNQASSLSALTVPASRLPRGCRLEPVNPKATGDARFVMYPGVHENPWIGTGRPFGASIRRVVDGAAGPTYDLQGPALRERLGEDVVESYRARYISADQAIEVYAVRFTDVSLTRAATMNRLIADPGSDRRPRIVVGTIAALVFQSPRPDVRATGPVNELCLRAVSQYIAALK